MRSSVRNGGVFSGFGVSSSFRVELDFPAFFVLPETSLAFFFADFGLGVGVWRRFDFGLRSGVSRGVGSGVASSSSSDFRLCFTSVEGIPVRPAIRYRRWSTLLLRPCRLLILRGESRLVLFSGVAEALCFFPDLSFDAFATGVGDFFGFGDGEECASLCSDSSCLGGRFFSSSTCAESTLPKITPETNAVVSQTRKGTTATERNRAREAINQIVKKVIRVTRL